MNSTTIPTSGNPIKVGGTNITQVDVVKSGVKTTVWKKSSGANVFVNGTLGEEISVNGFTKNGLIYEGTCVSLGGTESGRQIKVERTYSFNGIDLTGFNTVTISSTHYTANHYGTAYVRWGIDSANSSSTTFFDVAGGTEYYERTYTGSLNIASYSGVHNLVFYLYAECKSDYWGYRAESSLGITSIVLS